MVGTYNLTHLHEGFRGEQLPPPSVVGVENIGDGSGGESR